MKFDVIITTYNRPERVVNFINQIFECSTLPDKIIVVDSSDDINMEATRIKEVTYIRSLHKNQPYQRYLGAMVSDAAVLCFFDDDLTITDNTIFEHLLGPYKNSEVVGTSVGINYENPSDTSENALKSPEWFKKIFSVKIPHSGQISYAGIVGSKPSQIQAVEYFHGPCMCFKKEVFLSTLNTQLLCIFEKKLGMGEDKYISAIAAKKGRLIFNPQLFLYHPAIESSYFSNLSNFFTKNILSRKILTEAYCELNKKSRLHGSIKLWQFIIGRIIVSLVRVVLYRRKEQVEILKGQLNGIKHIIIPINCGIDWSREFRHNLEPNGDN